MSFFSKVPKTPYNSKETFYSNFPSEMNQEMNQDMNQESLEIKEPQQDDFLAGKGNGVQLHLGNIYLRERVKEHLQDYHVRQHGAKRKVAKIIYDAFPGRFLRLRQNSETKTWYEMEENEALDMISQKFRDQKKKVSLECSLILVWSCREEFGRTSVTHRRITFYFLFFITRSKKTSKRMNHYSKCP